MSIHVTHISEDRTVAAFDELNCTECDRHVGWSENGFTEYDLVYILDGMPVATMLLCEDCVAHVHEF